MTRVTILRVSRSLQGHSQLQSKNFNLYHHVRSLDNSPFQRAQET